MIGKVLAKRYRIVERIGGGGMALVFRAVDLQLQRDVALKILRGQFGSDEEFIRRFRREAQNAASLSHPNVVQIYDVGQDDESYFIVMELIEGRTLKALIQEQGPLPMEQAAQIGAEVLNALAHAHHHKIVHRDIKPHNILIARDGRVKVTDFGIARATTTDTVTHTGSIMGSAHYFSPEQANGLPTGDRSDIYSVGIVLYEMVTGVVPFQGESPISVALKHIRDAVKPPSQLNANVPVELEGIIIRALQKEPADRYPSANLMRQALQHFGQDHAAGQTHMHSGDFPTMDLGSMKSRRLRRQLEEDEADEAIVEERKPVRPAKKRRRSLAWLWVSLVALVVMGGIGAAVYAVVGFLDVPEVQVPNVSGLHLIQAQEELRVAQLFGAVKYEQFSDDVPQGYVMETRPAAGTYVKQGRNDIAIVLSRGPELKPLIDVRGRLEEQARADLESARFAINEVVGKHSQEAEGTVIEMNPAPLTPLRVGSRINLTVSLGPLRVPKIYGKLLDDARRGLTAVGLVVGRIDSIPDAAQPKDTVLASDPSPDTPVVIGQRVNLVVAQGPVGEGTTFEKEVTVPGEASQRVDFRVTLVDLVAGVPNQELLFRDAQSGQQIVKVSGTFFGEAYLQIFVDGRETQRVPLP